MLRSTVEDVVKAPNGNWLRVSFYGNGGQPWSYTAAREHWQQECGQGRPGHLCSPSIAAPPRYTATSSSPPVSPRHARTVGPSAPSVAAISREPTPGLQYIVIEGDAGIYTDQREVEEQVERMYSEGKRPKISWHTSLSEALHARLGRTQSRHVNSYKFDIDSLVLTTQKTTRKRQQEVCDQIAREQEDMRRKRTSEMRQRLVEAHQEAGSATIPNDSDMLAEDIWSEALPQDDAGDIDDSDWEDERAEMVVLCGDTRRRRRQHQYTLDREERARRAQQAWSVDMKELIHAYLQQKHRLVPDSHDAAGSVVWTITVLGVRELDWERSIVQIPGESANAALLRSGLLGSSPISPTIAFTIELLELYHQLRRHQSSLSIQAIVKTMCAIHNLTYHHTYRQQFSDAFDAYLAILRGVKVKVDGALGRTAGWDIKDRCAACSYRVPGEPMLRPTRLQAMDGNESLKRVAGWGHTDKRTFQSAFLISPDDVDKYKNDGTHKARGPRGEERSSPDRAKACTADGHWKTANASELGTETFDECGLFVSVCRHHLVQTFCPMIRSGELAKYGLATVNRLLDMFGEHQGIGYDIGCTHRTTISRSSLGEKAAALEMDITVDAFHGYAHNRQCQLRNHPLYREGYGLEDLSTCERVFSSSNSVARLVRHASKYHYGQFIDLHYRHWNDERYAETSK
ncbi:hypothetical protein HDZ31DRAFT_34840 [Schizophyllum fasciatum]